MRLKVRTGDYGTGIALVAAKLKSQGFAVYDPKNKIKLFHSAPTAAPAFMVKPEPDYPKIYEHQNLFTTFTKKKEIIEIGYEELKRKGFCIVSVPMRDAFFRGQSVAYIPCRRGEPIPSYSLILDSKPKDINIQLHTLYNAIRIMGRNCGPKAVSEWFLLNR